MKVAFRLVSDMVKELVPWSYDHKKVWLLPNEEQLKSAEQKKSADHAFPNLPEFSATACLRSGWTTLLWVLNLTNSYILKELLLNKLGLGGCFAHKSMGSYSFWGFWKGNWMAFLWLEFTKTQKNRGRIFSIFVFEWWIVFFFLHVGKWVSYSSISILIAVLVLRLILQRKLMW